MHPGLLSPLQGWADAIRRILAHCRRSALVTNCDPIPGPAPRETPSRCGEARRVLAVADSHIRRFWTSAGRAQRAPYLTSGASDVHGCMRPNRRARRRDGRWSGRVTPWPRTLWPRPEGQEQRFRRSPCHENSPGTRCVAQSSCPEAGVVSETTHLASRVWSAHGSERRFPALLVGE